MTDQQWKDLLAVVKGELLSPLPVGFIIDSPWLPNWYGISILDYFSSDALWLEANLKAINDFPEAMFLPELGVNLFNMGFDTDLNQLKELTRNQVTMMGNIPPRDVLAGGSPDQVREATLHLLKSLDNPSRVIFSCGGGMPPGVSSENMAIFIETVLTYHL